MDAVVSPLQFALPSPPNGTTETTGPGVQNNLNGTKCGSLRHLASIGLPSLQITTASQIAFVTHAFFHLYTCCLRVYLFDLNRKTERRLMGSSRHNHFIFRPSQLFRLFICSFTDHRHPPATFMGGLIKMHIRAWSDTHGSRQPLRQSRDWVAFIFRAVRYTFSLRNKLSFSPPAFLCRDHTFLYSIIPTHNQREGRRQLL